MRVTQALLLSLGIVPLAASSSARSAQWKVGQTVDTSSGPVSGHAAPGFDDVSEYLGIPFAQPPTGELRFQPPVKYNGTKAINGTSFGFSCRVAAPSGGGNKPDTSNLSKIAPAIVNASNPSTLPSEDCLTLNVWTRPQKGEAKKAVMVWIHGGAFTTGSSSVPWYNGETFVGEEDVIVVSINYRLSIFGFPGNPVGRPNLGLLDQRLAIEWVRDNIESFGGDPKRITLFGESSGGASADFYSYAWTEDPIATGFILMSGSAFGVGQLHNETANKYWFNATETAGCGGSSEDPDKVFDCMRKKSADDIAKSIPAAELLSNRERPFNPVFDEALVYSDYTKRKPVSAPVLVGNNDFEAGLAYLLQPDLAAKKELRKIVDLGFTCASALRAAASVKAGNPTWRYRWFGEFPNTQLTVNPPSKAYHTSELGVLFNTTLRHLLPDTPQEKEIGAYFRGLWAAFAKDAASGTTYHDNGLPMYSANSSSLIRIGYQNSTGPSLGMGGQYDGDCSKLIGGASPTSGSGANPTSSSTGAPSGTRPAGSLGTRLAPTTGLVFFALAIAALV